MRYLSLFSGIEAASIAWLPLGWEPVAFSEVDPFCNAVLERHYPDVPNLGDVKEIDWAAKARGMEERWKVSRPRRRREPVPVLEHRGQAHRPRRRVRPHVGVRSMRTRRPSSMVRMGERPRRPVVLEGGGFPTNARSHGRARVRHGVESSGRAVLRSAPAARASPACRAYWRARGALLGTFRRAGPARGCSDA